MYHYYTITINLNSRHECGVFMMGHILIPCGCFLTPLPLPNPGGTLKPLDGPLPRPMDTPLPLPATFDPLSGLTPME